MNVKKGLTEMESRPPLITYTDQIHLLWFYKSYFLGQRTLQFVMTKSPTVKSHRARTSHYNFIIAKDHSIWNVFLSDNLDTKWFKGLLQITIIYVLLLEDDVLSFLTRMNERVLGLYVLLLLEYWVLVEIL